MCPKTGKTYYGNINTGESRWDRPQPIQEAQQQRPSTQLQPQLQPQRQVQVSVQLDQAVVGEQRGQGQISRQQQMMVRRAPEMSIVTSNTQGYSPNGQGYNSTQSIKPDVTDLPQGWKALVCPKTGRTYYGNIITGESRWDRPQPIQEAQQRPSTQPQSQSQVKVQVTQVKLDQAVLRPGGFRVGGGFEQQSQRSPPPRPAVQAQPSLLAPRVTPNTGPQWHPRHDARQDTGPQRSPAPRPAVHVSPSLLAPRVTSNAVHPRHHARQDTSPGFRAAPSAAQHSPSALRQPVQPVASINLQSGSPNKNAPSFFAQQAARTPQARRNPVLNYAHNVQQLPGGPIAGQSHREEGAADNADFLARHGEWLRNVRSSILYGDEERRDVEQSPSAFEQYSHSGTNEWALC